MKKLTSFLLCVVMLCSLIACSSQKAQSTNAQNPTAATQQTTVSSDTSSNSTAEKAEASSGLYLDSLTPPASKRALTVGTGSSSGEVYILGGAMANSLNIHSSWFTLTNEAASGGNENLRNMKDGIIDMGMMNCDNGYEFYTSTGTFAESGGDDSLRSMIVLPPSPMHIVVRAGSGIKSIEDLRGKHVGFGTVGTGYEAFAKRVVECAGMTYADMDAQMMSVNQFADAMKNGQIDAFFFPVQAPSGTITELAISLDVEILSLSDDFIQKYISENMGYVSATIAANSYKGQTTELKTVATSRFAPVLRDNFTEDEAYVFLHDIFDNRDEWVNVYSSASYITPTNITGLIVPLHAGAVRFYRENGVEIPEELIPPEAK